MNYTIENAKIIDKEEIQNLYSSLIGQKGCTWDEEYPTKEDIERDILNKELICLRNENEIIAVATLTKKVDIKKEINTNGNLCLLTRVGVKRNYQGQGYSKILLQYIIETAKNMKFDYIYLLVNQENIIAKKLYKTLGFKFNKNIKLYELEWELLVKRL